MIKRITTCYICILTSLSNSLAVSQSECIWNAQQTLRRQEYCLRPVNDSTDLLGAHIWTHHPVCSDPQGTEQLAPRNRLCVYSSSNYNDGFGISLVTTPETAAIVADAISRLAIAECQVKEGQNHPEVDRRVPYEVRDIPGRGKGMVATRNISQFEVIIAELPAMVIESKLVLPRRPDAGKVAKWKPRGLFEVALNQLTNKNRFLAMAQSMDDDTMHAVENVIRTNSFGISIDDQAHKGVYPEVGRINHGCNPSAMTSFKAGTLEMRVVALRDIMSGEEILQSYIPVGIPFAYRQRSLEKWGFGCSCSLCSAAEVDRVESDRRRERVADLLESINGYVDDYGQMLKMTKEFLALIEREGLTERFGEYYHDLMMLYYRHGDLESSIKYGELALKYAEALGDLDDGFCNHLREMLGTMRAEL